MNLSNKRLAFRYPRLADAPMLVKYVNNPKIGNFISYKWKNISLAKEKSWINRQKSLRRKGKAFAFVIKDKVLKDTIGVIDIHDIEKENKYGKLGAWIATKYWGKGYTKDALITLLKFAFGYLKLNKIVWQVFDYNKNSQRFAEKFGFKKEYTDRERFIRKVKLVDEITYSILKKDYLRKAKLL